MPRGPGGAHEHEHRLRAADGWLGLGDWGSANDELEALPPLLRAHPQVLVLHVRVYAAAGRWDVAEEIELKMAETPAAEAELMLVLGRSALLRDLKAEAKRL